jgi:hypothetical protein
MPDDKFVEALLFEGGTFIEAVRQLFVGHEAQPECLPYVRLP